MTPGCSTAGSPRPVVPVPCSSTGGRDRMAGFADTMAPGIPCIASRAMGVIRRDHPTDDAEDGDQGSADRFGRRDRTHAEEGDGWPGGGWRAGRLPRRKALSSGHDGNAHFPRCAPQVAIERGEFDVLAYRKLEIG